AEFQKILDHRGYAPLSPLYPLARLGLARAAALTGETAKSRKAYGGFLAGWEEADAGSPIFIGAEKDYGRPEGDLRDKRQGNRLAYAQELVEMKLLADAVRPDRPRAELRDTAAGFEDTFKQLGSHFQTSPEVQAPSGSQYRR